MATLSATTPPPLLTDWPAAPPVLDWQPADCEPAREAFTRLLTRDTPHRVVLIRGPSGTGKSHLTRYLFSLALNCDWLACGRFDLKSGADLDDEFSRFVLHLGEDEAVRAVAGGSARSRLDGVFSALLSTIASKPNRFRQLEPGVRICRISKLPYSILYTFKEGNHLPCDATR